VRTEEYAALRREASRQTVSTMLALWLGMGSYRDGDVPGFLAEALPTLRAGQETMAGVVAEYLGTLAATVAATTLAPLLIPAALVTDLRPVPATEVYTRPFRTVWTALARGQDYPRAVQVGADRLARIAEMDMQATYAQANRVGMERLPDAVRPEYWRRVLVGAENCAMCVIASTNRYRRGDLNPIHPGCDCRVEPVLRGADDPLTPEREAALLRRAQAAANELTGITDLGGRKVDFRAITTNITAEHGEHAAPLLVRPLDRFTGPENIPRDARVGGRPERKGRDTPERGERRQDVDAG
jgi:hypothetical protein